MPVGSLLDGASGGWQVHGRQDGLGGGGAQQRTNALGVLVGAALAAVLACDGSITNSAGPGSGSVPGGPQSGGSPGGGADGGTGGTRSDGGVTVLSTEL